MYLIQMILNTTFELYFKYFKNQKNFVKIYKIIY